MKITVNNENYDVELAFSIVNAINNVNKQYVMIGNEKIVNDNYIYYIGEVVGDKLLGVSEEDWSNAIKDNITSILSNKIKTSEVLTNKNFVIDGSLKGLQIPVNAINAYREATKEISNSPVNEEIVTPESNNIVEANTMVTDEQVIPTVEEPTIPENSLDSDQSIINDANNISNNFTEQISNQLNSEINNSASNEEIINEKYQKILSDLNNVKQEIFELEELLNSKITKSL